MSLAERFSFLRRRYLAISTDLGSMDIISEISLEDIPIFSREASLRSDLERSGYSSDSFEMKPELRSSIIFSASSFVLLNWEMLEFSFFSCRVASEVSIP